MAALRQLFQLLRQNKLEQLEKHLDQQAIHWQNEYGWSLLHQAVSDKNSEAVELLIAQGIDLNLTDSEGCTPLHFAVCKELVDITELLVKAGADPNLKDNGGMTPLRWAVTQNHCYEQLVDLLLAGGADPWIENLYGSSAVDYAETVGLDLVRRLKKVKKTKQPPLSPEQDKLSTILLDLGGKTVQQGLSQGELSRLIERGRAFSCQDLVVRRLRMRECHKNVAIKAGQKKYQSASIVTGYALSDQIWFIHSWLYHKKQIVETTLALDNYYGYELSKAEAIAFIDAEIGKE